MKQLLTTILLLLAVHFGFSQKNTATISGLVENENGKPMQGVSVVILGRESGVATDNNGNFSIVVRTNRAVALVFSSIGFKKVQKDFNLLPGETETIVVQMLPGDNTLDTAVVSGNRRERQTAGLVRINAKKVLEAPAPIMGVENLIKVFVGSNNELSSQYNVRGGAYDENLVYVNDFEVFRPYLVRNGQQEGLSFINAELANNVLFYNGGFQAKYGDKMSSVLDVEYKKPKEFHGSAYISLLEQGLSFEGTALKKKFTYLVGVRNRSLRNLLSSQETKGNYIPSSADLQGQLTWQPSNKWLFELLGNMSGTSFKLFPEESKQTTSVFSPLFTQNLGLDIFFEGRELDRYKTRMIGLSSTYFISNSFKLKGMLSYFNNHEEENVDISGAYLFGDRDFDKSSASFGLITNPLGAGVFQTFSRNRLDITVLNASVKGSLDKGDHYIQFGSSIEQNNIEDRLNEWEMQDSAGYSLPNNPGPLNLYKSLKGTSNIDVTRLSGYVQDNIKFRNKFTLQAGVRYNYNTLNKEFLVSPRAGISYSPNWKKDIIFRASAGIYNQPPFYREMRRYDGTVNTSLKSQKSWQVSGGFDYSFKGLGGRPFRFNVEAYYKNMRDVVPYDIYNVQIRYFGENMAKAYAYGVETRLFGELVKDAESWISIGVMKTMEDLAGDSYTDANGKTVDVGYVRRPTDRRLNIGMYFSDYLSTNKNFKVYVQGLYGTNMPYNIPNSTRWRNALEIPAYIRVDMGFAAQLLSQDKTERRSHNPFRSFENMWLSLEVFNLLDRSNTISYTLVKDFANNFFSVPNRLTPRLLNVKLVARW